MTVFNVTKPRLNTSDQTVETYKSFKEGVSQSWKAPCFVKLHTDGYIIECVNADTACLGLVETDATGVTGTDHNVHMVELNSFEVSIYSATVPQSTQAMLYTDDYGLRVNGGIHMLDIDNTTQKFFHIEGFMDGAMYAEATTNNWVAQAMGDSYARAKATINVGVSQVAPNP